MKNEKYTITGKQIIKFISFIQIIKNTEFWNRLLNYIDKIP